MSGRSAETTSACDAPLQRPPVVVRHEVGREPGVDDLEHRVPPLVAILDRVQQYLHAPIEHATRTAPTLMSWQSSRAGRPRASSRETLAEAACELFLEQGYEATSIADITTRAGVSRSSFFNYFASKSDILWSGLDERVGDFEAHLDGQEGTDAAAGVRAAAHVAVRGLRARQPRARPRQRRRHGTRRRARARGVVPTVAHRAGGHRPPDARPAPIDCRPMWPERPGAARCSRPWTRGRTTERGARPWRDSSRAQPMRPLPPLLSPRPGRCVSCASSCRRPTSTPRSRSIATSLGMPQAEAYEAEGGARVAILDAGRATLELANPPQVAFIDGVETDGGCERPHPDRARGRRHRLRSSIASPRRVPRSRHPLARRRGDRSTRACAGPADLQLTLFQELGTAPRRGAPIALA